MSLLSEVLVISGVAMDLVGATVLSHAHNAESMVDIRVEIGAVAAFNNVSPAVLMRRVRATERSAERRSSEASCSGGAGI